MQRYDKLVRDGIPDVLTEQGLHPHTVRVDGDQRLDYLKRKLLEEAEEVVQADAALEELADVYEVLLALLQETGKQLKDVQDAADQKRQRRGGFERGIVLKAVEDPNQT